MAERRAVIRRDKMLLVIVLQDIYTTQWRCFSQPKHDFRRATANNNAGTTAKHLDCIWWCCCFDCFDSSNWVFFPVFFFFSFFVFCVTLSASLFQIMKFYIISDLAQRFQRARTLWRFTLMNFLNFLPFPEAKCQPRTLFCSLVVWPWPVTSAHGRPCVYLVAFALSPILALSGSPLLMLARRPVCLLYSLPLLWFPSLFLSAANGRGSWQETREGNGRKEPGFVCHWYMFHFPVKSLHDSLVVYFFHLGRSEWKC